MALVYVRKYLERDHIVGVMCVQIGLRKLMGRKI